MSQQPITSIHDGRHYEWSSDRFYLDQPIPCPYLALGSISPYFSRTALVESLVADNELVAAVFQTYSLCLSAMKADFPSMLETSGSRPQIPLLLLHGDNENSIEPEPQDELDRKLGCRRYRRRLDVATSDDEEFDQIAEDMVKDGQFRSHLHRHIEEEEIELPAQTVVVEIKPTVSGEEKAQGRKRSMGVFHPKSMLLFCKSRLIVVVSLKSISFSLFSLSRKAAFFNALRCFMRQLSHLLLRRRDRFPLQT